MSNITADADLVTIRQLLAQRALTAANEHDSDLTGAEAADHAAMQLDEWVDQLRAYAPDRNADPAAIIGTDTLSQLQSQLGAGSAPLSGTPLLVRATLSRLFADPRLAFLDVEDVVAEATEAGLSAL